MPAVSVVTDSTCYLPADLIRRHGISLVSLRYSFGNGDSHREADLEDYSAFFDELQTAETLPTTSPPRVEDLVAAYEPLLVDSGSVISVHISSGLSQTCEMARRAVADLTAAGKGGERIHVMDSASTGMQLGLLVLAAARAAAAGHEAEAAVDLVRQARLESRAWFMLDTLEFLKRGGRIGSAAAWVGSTLNIKPILTIESEMKAVERVRTRERGVERLIDYGRQLHSAGMNGWGVQYSSARDDADSLVERLREVFWRPPEFVAGIGPVIGTHTGPGLLGVGGVPSRFLE